MRRLLKNSLLLNLGLAMTAIISLGFVGMLSSVIIAETTEGQAAAINQAGTLRMQSYRIASSLFTPPEQGATQQGRDTETHQLILEFSDRITSPRLTQVIPFEPADPVAILYRRITDRWQQQILPVLRAFDDSQAGLMAMGTGAGEAAERREAGLTLEHYRKQYLAMVDVFVADIDRLVRQLEETTEAKIQLLRLIQIIILFATIAVVFLAMYMVQSRVLSPLRELLICAEHARSGDFSIHTPHTGSDELGRLGHAFNLMAENLSRIYADLERRVYNKTRDLERSNRSLELLYKTTHQLSIKSLSEATYNALLQDIGEMLGLGNGTICLSSSEQEASQRDRAQFAFQLASTRELLAEGPDLCNPPNCSRCFKDGTSHTIDVEAQHGGRLRVFSTPIKDQGQQYGVLLMEIPANKELQDWQARLLEAVASHFGIALSLAQRASQERRLALLEERNVIARELHDSLAQSLSYMKIQVSRLDMALAAPDGAENGRVIIAELRQGLNSAYRELRELLTTFRLRIEGRGLLTALQETVSEFQQRGGLDIGTETNLSGGELSANEEVNVLQIIREALSNVVQHAHASQANVRLLHDGLGHISVQIDDDGTGIQASPRQHHYGTTIMQERARSLGGEIRYLQRPSGGTRVELIFKPSVHNENDEIGASQETAS